MASSLENKSSSSLENELEDYLEKTFPGYFRNIDDMIQDFNLISKYDFTSRCEFELESDEEGPIIGTVFDTVDDIAPIAPIAPIAATKASAFVVRKNCQLCKFNYPRKLYNKYKKRVICNKCNQNIASVSMYYHKKINCTEFLTICKSCKHGYYECKKCELKFPEKLLYIYHIRSTYNKCS